MLKLFMQGTEIASVMFNKDGPSHMLHFSGLGRVPLNDDDETFWAFGGPLHPSPEPLFHLNLSTCIDIIMQCFKCVLA